LTFLLVVIAGGIGVAARYAIGQAVSPESLGTVTLAINVAGSAMLGFLVAARDLFPREIDVALAVGLLGGFTTFSTFTVDVFMDWRGGREDEAIFYLFASVVFGLGAAALGYYFGRAVTD
jgi:CrcB protein